ncbi:hypothetical protein ACWC09_39945 [Streptomyces sp. NPDC001617]
MTGRAGGAARSGLAGGAGRAEGYGHRVMLDAVHHVVDNGVQMGQPARGLRAVSARAAFARRWQATGLLAELHDQLRDRVRQKHGRIQDPMAAIADSQSARAAANIPRPTSGWDAGRRWAAASGTWWWTERMSSRPAADSSTDKIR